MIPGPDKAVQCPHCGAIEKYRTLISGNTIGMALWTDGKSWAPMLPLPPEVACCHECGDCYWLFKATPWRVGAFGTIDDAPFVREPDASEYHAALEHGIASSPEEEKRVRIGAWWRHNDSFRHLDAPDASSRAGYDETSLRNLVALRDLLSRDPNCSIEGRYPEVLFRAEACRHLGEFDQARELLCLSGFDDEELMLAVIETIGELCDQGDRIVHRVDTEKVRNRRSRERIARDAPAFTEAWLEPDPAGRLQDYEIQKAYRAWIESRGGRQAHMNFDSMPLEVLGYEMDGPNAIRGARLRRPVPGFFDTGSREWRDTWKKWLEDRSGTRRT